MNEMIDVAMEQAQNNTKEPFVPSKRRFRVIWFLTGLVWGFICQLAMIGVILLSTKYNDVASNLWFECQVVFLFTSLNAGGPFAVRSALQQTVGSIPEATHANISNVVFIQKSLVWFSLLGSNVSVCIFQRFIQLINISCLNAERFCFNLVGHLLCGKKHCYYFTLRVL